MNKEDMVNLSEFVDRSGDHDTVTTVLLSEVNPMVPALSAV